MPAKYFCEICGAETEQHLKIDTKGFAIHINIKDNTHMNKLNYLCLPCIIKILSKQV